jgi:hypothetical protein
MYDIQYHEDWRRKPRTGTDRHGNTFTWRPITGEDEMDGWNSLHLACYYGRVRDVQKYSDKTELPVLAPVLPSNEAQQEDVAVQIGTVVKPSVSSTEPQQKPSV